MSGVMAHARLLAAVAAVLAFLTCGAASAAKWGANYFPNLPVVTQDGKVLKLYDDLLKDKIVVVDFVFTTCQQICPLFTARMAQLQHRLGDRVGRDVFLYSFSLDPERDTPEALKAYAEAFDAGPGWLFLTGDPGELRTIRHKLGERSRRPSEHNGMIMLGNGKTGDWQRTSQMQDVDRLVKEINEMDPVWRAQEHVRAGPAYASIGTYDLSRSPGHAFFAKACAACHTVGGGDRIGPDLLGVTDRRDHDWLVRFLMAPDRMRANKDPAALELAARYRAAMPNLGLSPTDARDLLAYLAERSKQPASPRAAPGR